jgi:hypothetical protein
VNRFEIRLPVGRRTAGLAGLAASCLVAVAALAGCGAGQIAQTSVQEPAVNGASGVVKQVALRNVYIEAVQNGDFLRPGQTVGLNLVATNQSPDVADRLVRITSDIGAVTLTGDARLPAGGVLMVGTSAAQNIKAVGTVEAADAAKATVALSKPISNGLTYPFTFDFEKAGSVTFPVPISAGQDSQNRTPAEQP